MRVHPSRALSTILFFFFLSGPVPVLLAQPRQFDRVVIGIGDRPGAITKKAADICRRWISRRSGAAVRIEQGPPTGDGDLWILLGRAEEHAALRSFLTDNLKDLPTPDAPGSEGFTLATSLRRKPAVVAVAGVDARGVLYGAGELLLRKIAYLESAIELSDFDVVSAPAFPIRGGNAAHISEQVLRVMPVRNWSEEEWEDYAIEQVLNGANNFDIWRLNNYNFPEKHFNAYTFFRSLGLDTTTGNRLNNLPGHPEWRGSEGGDWVCPSIPAARTALLKDWERQFAAAPAYDYLRLYSGDPGGCRDDRCKPSWGAIYIKLCEEAAGIWLKHHPQSKVIVTNQELTNDGDRAIFDYLQQAPRPWLYALNYGPGSNAMATYYRSEMRKDLFKYPGLGQDVRYLQEIQSQLPAAHKIVHFSDITHWIQSQFGLDAVDPVLAAAHGRRTIYMTPRRHRELFHKIVGSPGTELEFAL